MSEMMHMVECDKVPEDSDYVMFFLKITYNYRTIYTDDRRKLSEQKFHFTILSLNFVSKLIAISTLVTSTVFVRRENITVNVLACTYSFSNILVDFSS